MRSAKALCLLEWAGGSHAGGNRIIDTIVGGAADSGPCRTLKEAMALHTRTVFFVSDGTGITAETFGNAILAQFEMKPRHVRRPFIDTVDKAHQAVRQINHTGEVE